MFSWRTQKLILLFLVSCLPSGSASAQQLSLAVESIREDDGFLEVGFALGNPFVGELETHLERGVPCTISYSIDLWKKRSGWFDKLVASRLLFFRVQFDLWKDGYAIQTMDGKLPTASNLEELAETVAGHQRTRVLPLAMLEPDASYFLSIEVSLAPLSVQDIEELERWMKGGEKRRGGRVPGGGSLSRLFLRIAASFVGLGKKTAMAKTHPFTLQDLFSSPQ